ncbi:hypothetical protein PO124_22415 [Bacillus licheniformis]|nr:hypothetical protein [Bacillus licheniformis]
MMITVVFDVKEPAVRPESAFGWFMSKFSVLLQWEFFKRRLHARSFSGASGLKCKASGDSICSV